MEIVCTEVPSRSRAISDPVVVAVDAVHENVADILVEVGRMLLSAGELDEVPCEPRYWVGLWAEAHAVGFDLGVVSSQMVNLHVGCVGKHVVCVWVTGWVWIGHGTLEECWKQGKDVRWDREHSVEIHARDGATHDGVRPFVDQGKWSEVR